MVYIAFMKSGRCGWAIDDIKIRWITDDDVEENIITDLEFFPNPADDFVNVTGENIEHLEVYSAVGQLVMNVNLADESKVNVANLEGGVFFFSINDKNGNKVVKKVIRK